MNNTLQPPEFLFFAQHGWSDNGNDISRLAKALVTDNSLIFAPSLGLLKTYWRIESLIEQVANLASEQITQYPEVPLKIMGHSMGGLIWLEVLNRHPEWWQKVHSLVVIGSPIGGADLARMIDPLGIGIGIARDLGINRRSLAEKIAQQIPTLCIASDLGNGSDGMVNLATTQFAHAQFVCVDGIPHAHLKCHPQLVPIIQDFWSNPQITNLKLDFATQIIRSLQQIPGMTDASYHYLERSRRDPLVFDPLRVRGAQVMMELPQGISIRTSKNFARINHIFVTDRDEKCLYAGYVGWLHNNHLQQALQELKQGKFEF